MNFSWCFIRYDILYFVKWYSYCNPFNITIKTNKMKQIYPFFALLFISYFSFAQYENFDLSKYKLPEIKRHQLDLSFNFNNDYQNSDTDNDFFDIRSSLNERLDLNYSFFCNSKELQRNYSTRLLSNFDMSKENQNDELIEKNRNLFVSLDLEFDNRYYLNEDKFFLHLNPGVQASYQWDKDKRKNQQQKDKTIDKYIFFIPSFDFGLGSGRIEPIGDLRHVIYIVNEFEKNELAKRTLSEEEVYTIATKISRLKNKRFFDSRIRRIYEINSLDSMLQSMDILSQNGATYFTVLNDMWSYGDEERYSGNRIQFDVLTRWWYYKHSNTDGTIYLYDGNVNETSQTDKTKYAELGAELTYESFKPLGLKWQREISSTASFERQTKPHYEPDYEGSARNQYNLIIKYAYNWFMNTRTSAAFGCRGRYRRYDYVDGSYNRQEYHAILFGNVYYYFSPRLRLSYQINCHYGIIDGDNNYYNNRIDISNRLTFNYAIF